MFINRKNQELRFKNEQINHEKLSNLNLKRVNLRLKRYKRFVALIALNDVPRLQILIK